MFHILVVRTYNTKLLINYLQYSLLHTNLHNDIILLGTT